MDIPDYEDVEDQQKVDVRKFKGMSDENVSLAGWNQLYLKEQLIKAIQQIGFEYPSQVQKQAIPIIMQGKDLLCQAQSGMGKTAVFVIGILNQLHVRESQYVPCSCLVICHTRELAHQIFKDFLRLSRYFRNPPLKIACFFGGFKIELHIQQLKKKQLPHIIIGTPGRLIALMKQKVLPMNNIQFLVIDECDKMLTNDTFNRDLRKIFDYLTNPRQVMMFSATMPQSTKQQAKKFMSSQQHIVIDAGKLVLNGLAQFNVHLFEYDKLETLMKLLDKVAFNQGVIFVNTIQRAKKLTNLLIQKLFASICIHSGLTQEERIKNYDKFKNNQARFLLATDLFGRGIDIQRVNLVINYDLPMDVDTYMHRIGRAGRFNTKGVIINFVCKIGDEQHIDSLKADVLTMKQIQQRLQAPIPELPENFQSQKYI